MTRAVPGVASFGPTVRSSLTLFLAALLPLTACTFDPRRPAAAGDHDGAVRDAADLGVGADAGRPRADAGFDGGDRDAGAPLDGGVPDGGERDGGAVTDAGERDGGTPDSGVRDGGERDGGTPDSGLRDGGAAPPLVQTGVVLRYFLDEAASGTAAAVIDSGRAPGLDLQRFGSSNGPFHVTRVVGRGLTWNQAASSGAFAATASSKIFSDLDGTRRLTIEVVVDPADATVFGSRILHIGDGGQTDLGLIMTDQNVYLGINGFTHINWPLNVRARAGPTVLTVVYDSERSSINDRLDLYVDGMPGPISMYGPDEEQTFDIDSNATVIIGNSGRNDRSLAGDILYVAVYDRPLSATEVANNAAALLVDHDTR